MGRKRQPSKRTTKIRNPAARSPLLGKGGAHRDSKAKRRREDKSALGDALSDAPEANGER